MSTKSKIRKILWMTWKDKKHPLAGGAEVVNEELAKRLAKDDYEVIILTGGFEGCEKEESVDGYKIIRVGSSFSVYWKAQQFYKENFVGWADLVIDEINTIPFLCKFYVKENNILFVHQLCRKIWFYELGFPLNFIGYLAEPIYLRLLNDRKVITVSKSTKNDLIRHGFKEDRIFIIPEGLESPPISEQEFTNSKKEKNPTVIYLGSVRNMKRPKHVFRAFEIAKEKIPTLKLFVVGSGKSKYANEFFQDIKSSKYSKDIECFGRVDNKKKLEVLKRAHVICVTSVKEGWGLVVTEANSCGTPAIAYNVDGLRDSCKNGVTGVVCDSNPSSMARGIIELFKNKELYMEYRHTAWKDSFNYNYENSYNKFLEIING